MVSILVDDTIMMRSLQSGDVSAYFEAVNASRLHLRKWLTWVDLTTKEEHILQYIQKTEQQIQNQESIVLGIFFHQKIIGEIGMYEWSRSLKKGKIGYWISHEFEGKSVMHKCFERFADFLFKKAELNKIEIRFVPQNKRSAKLSERMGCKVEGVLRQSFLLHGQLHDLVVTGLLSSEWVANK